MTVTKKTVKSEFKLDPKEYKRKLGYVELKNIYLDSFSATSRRDKLSGSIRTIVDDNREYELQENGSAIFKHSFQLIGTRKYKKDYGIKIKCTYSLQFDSTDDLEEEFWDIFSEVNLHINTWPYFRELVQNTTQRMSIMPLTLPLLK